MDLSKGEKILEMRGITKRFSGGVVAMPMGVYQKTDGLVRNCGNGLQDFIS